MTTINLSNMKSHIKNISHNEVIVYKLNLIFFLISTCRIEHPNAILPLVLFIFASYVDYRRGINIHGFGLSNSVGFAFTLPFCIIICYLQGNALLEPLLEQNYITYLEPVNIINCIIYSLVVTFFSISVLYLTKILSFNASSFYSSSAALIAVCYDCIKGFL